MEREEENNAEQVAFSPGGEARGGQAGRRAVSQHRETRGGAKAVEMTQPREWVVLCQQYLLACHALIKAAVAKKGNPG